MAASFSTEWDVALFNHMNRARTSPQVVAQELAQLKPMYDGVMFTIPGTNKVMKTVEGIAALNHAIRYMEKQTPLPAFRKISEGLSRAAYDLVLDNGSRGIVGNTLSDGTSAQHRWVRYGQWKGKVGENICFNMQDPVQVLYQWLIDDGNGNRTNRRSLMDEQFTVVGVAQGNHVGHVNMVVVTFALAFIDGDPGVVPKLGHKSTPDSKTVQYEDRKTEEAVLGAGDTDSFVIESDDLETDDPSTLQLSAKSKIITLSKTFRDGSKQKKKNFQWQLPFNFNPSLVSAHFANRKVTIRIPKDTAAGLANEEVLIGRFTLPAGSGSDTVKVDVKPEKGAIVINALPSRFDEEITITFRADIVTFTCTHLGADGKPTGLAQPLRLPFVLSSSLFSSNISDAGIILNVAKPGAQTSVNIPIHS